VGGHTFPVKELFRVAARERNVRRDRAEELDNERNVVFVAAVRFAPLGMEQIVARRELKQLRVGNDQRVALGHCPQHAARGKAMKGSSTKRIYKL
jgi:hypothetical protein